MRLLHLSKKAQNAGQLLAPRGTPERAALARTLNELGDASIPLVGSGDREVVHGSSVMGRPVPGTALVVCYVPGGDDVFVVNVVREP